MKKFEELIDEELRQTEEEHKTKQLLMHRGALLNQRNPLDLIISAFNEADSFIRKGIVVLNEDYIIKGMTRTAKRILDYRQKHENPPCFDRPYTELLHTEQINEFNEAVRERKTRVSNTNEYFIQKIFITNIKGNRVYINSRVIGYKETKIRSLYGIILGWKEIKIR